VRKTSDLRKAEIVATILGLADRIGPDRVTTGAVAAEVGVTQAAIFRHFPTKAVMWNAVADHVAETLTTAWDTALATADLPVERIKALVGAQLGQIAAIPAMPMLLFSRELNVENAALREAFRGRLATFHGHLMRAVAEGQKSQALRGDVVAADVAVLLTSLVQGVAIRWSLGARDFALRAEGLRLLDVQLRLLAAKEV
jgi:TetR/AcrR family transcriptional regulator